MTGFFSVFFGFFAAVSLAAGYRGGAAAQTFRTERREKEEVERRGGRETWRTDFLWQRGNDVPLGGEHLSVRNVWPQWRGNVADLTKLSSQEEVTFPQQRHSDFNSRLRRFGLRWKVPDGELPQTLLECYCKKKWLCTFLVLTQQKPESVFVHFSLLTFWHSRLRNTGKFWWWWWLF